MTADVLASITLALGDDELVLGHRHSEWTGYAPHIEEDVAFSSIAQDEIGHAAAYFAIAGRALNQKPDELAFGREPDAYHNALLCERPNREWAYSLARHWLYDTAEDLRLESLAGSSDPELAALTTKMRREERYHLLHADTWMKRVAHGPVEGRQKLIHAVTEAFRDALELFEPFEREEEAIKEGILTIPSPELRERFLARAATELDELGLPSGVTPLPESDNEFVASSSGDLIAGEEHVTQPPEGGTSEMSGRRGQHTEDFRELWDVMTKTYRANPGARW